MSSSFSREPDSPAADEPETVLVDADGDPTGRPAARQPGPGLHLVATPIGNLRDVSLRALDILARVDLIACEDTRITARLLAAYDIRVRTTPYHEHNAETARPILLARMAAGGSVALVSDAGTPLVSDPGYRLVQATIQAGLPVTAAPGANAAITALTLSGLPPDRFLFAGFLPNRSTARRTAIQAVAQIQATLLFYETAPRLVASLADLAELLGDRPAAVARELTKRFEEVRRGTLAELAAHYLQAGPPRGEIVLVIGPPPEAVPIDDPETVDRLLLAALATGGTREAAAGVAAATGLNRRDLYRRALQLRPAREESAEDE